MHRLRRLLYIDVVTSPKKIYYDKGKGRRRRSEKEERTQPNIESNWNFMVPKMQTIAYLFTCAVVAVFRIPRVCIFLKLIYTFFVQLWFFFSVCSSFVWQIFSLMHACSHTFNVRIFRIIKNYKLKTIFHANCLYVGNFFFRSLLLFVCAFQMKTTLKLRCSHAAPTESVTEKRTRRRKKNNKRNY